LYFHFIWITFIENYLPHPSKLSNLTPRLTQGLNSTETLLLMKKKSSKHLSFLNLINSAIHTCSAHQLLPRWNQLERKIPLEFTDQFKMNRIKSIFQAISIGLKSNNCFSRNIRNPRRLFRVIWMRCKLAISNRSITPLQRTVLRIAIIIRNHNNSQCFLQHTLLGYSHLFWMLKGC